MPTVVQPTCPPYCATHLSSVTPPFTPLLPTSPQSIQMPLCNPPLLSEERHSQYFATFYGITEEHTWEMKLPHKTDHVAGKVEISGRGGRRGAQVSSGWRSVAVTGQKRWMLAPFCFAPAAYAAVTPDGSTFPACTTKPAQHWGNILVGQRGNVGPFEPFWGAE